MAVLKKGGPRPRLSKRNRLSHLWVLALLSQLHCGAVFDAREGAGSCGDGVKQELAGEECDDGNTEPGDKCSPRCTIETCGNGIVDHGEQCDHGLGNDDGGDCTRACQFARCGDGLLRTRGDATIPYERCDDGNNLNGDGCNPQCELRGRLAVIAGEPGGKGVADGIGNAARFGGITGMIADAKHVYLYDGGACAIRRFHRATHVVETIAGGKDGCSGHTTDGSPSQATFGGVRAQLARAGDFLYVGEGSLLRRVNLREGAADRFYVRSCFGFSDEEFRQQGGFISFVLSASQDKLYAATFRALYQVTLPCDCQPLSSAPNSCRPTLLAGHPQQEATQLVDKVAAADARFLALVAMAEDASDRSLYIADATAIRRLDYDTQTITTFAGDDAGNYAGYGAVDGPRHDARFGQISAMIAHQRSLYVLDKYIGRDDADHRLAVRLGWTRLRKIDLSASDSGVTSPLGVFGLVGNGAGEIDGFGGYSRFIDGESLALASDSGQDLLFIGSGASIRAVDLNSNVVTTAAGSLVNDATFHNVNALATHQGKLYAMNEQRELVQISLEQAAPHELMPLCPTFVGISHQVVAATVDAGDPRRDDDDYLYLVDDGLFGICRINLKTRKAQVVWRDPNTTNPSQGEYLGWGVSGLAHDGKSLYLVASWANQILRLDVADLDPTQQRGPLTEKAPEPVKVQAALKLPRKAVFVQGRLFVTSQENNLVIGVDVASGASIVLGSGEAMSSDSPACPDGQDAPGCPQTSQQRLATVNFCHPMGIATNGKQLFVSEGFCPSRSGSFHGNAVRQIELDTFNVTTLIGAAGPARLVEGEGANAAVNFPAALSYDAKTRSLYLADAWENVLARVD
jgi:cysteine-rich repeat protein